MCIYIYIYIHKYMYIYIYIYIYNEVKFLSSEGEAVASRRWSEVEEGGRRFAACEGTLEGTNGGPTEEGLNSVNMRVGTCKKLGVNHDHISCCLRPPFLGTPLVPS